MSRSAATSAAHPLRILFADMDAYFASCEQYLRPELRGKAVAIVPSLCDTTCCIATSYEAKKHGIKTGTSVREAKTHMPTINIVEARPATYTELHHQLIRLCENILPIEGVHSIDEWHFRLLGNECQPEKAQHIACQVKQIISENFGSALHATMGIGPNLFLAKMAAEMNKPNGLGVIHPTQLPHALDSLQLTDLTGIAKGMQKRLNKAGIYSVSQLTRCNEQTLQRALGSTVSGSWWHSALQGKELPIKSSHRRSYSQSHVLPPSLRTTDGAYRCAGRLLTRAARRMRKDGWKCSKLRLEIRIGTGAQSRVLAHELSLQPAASDDISLIQGIKSLWPKSFSDCQPPVQVCLHLLQLKHPSHGLSLFHDDQKRSRLSQVCDQITDKLGSNAIQPGLCLGMHNHAQARIAFSHIPENQEFETQEENHDTTEPSPIDVANINPTTGRNI